ncbi:MAG: HEAT repeat domain-containing protein [Acidimicrobiia bacterium]|nr:HEAT repeat domain-containing protein [Acidimicrobiia bacterium]
MTTEAPAALQPVDTAEIVDAFGLAWATFTLYEDPIGIDSFARAVRTLTRCPAFPFTLAVGPESFLEEGEPVPHRREATVRLARRIFGMGAAAVEFVGAPTGTDLITAFRIVAAGEEDPNRTLADRGVSRIAFRRRVLGDGAAAPSAEPSLVSSYAGDPDPFVRDLVEKPGADPSSVAREFVAEYRRVMDLRDHDDRWAAEEIVHAFVDAFWYLPPAHRAAVVASMLDNADDASGVFLDQFSGSEIAELDRQLSDGTGGHPMLAAYLDAAARHGDHRRDDLHATGDAATGSVAALLDAARAGGDGERRAVLDRLRAAAPDRRAHARAALRVIRGLLVLGVEQDDLDRPADLWAERTAAAIAARAPSVADAWVDLVRAVDDDGRATLLTELGRRMDRDALDGLVALFEADDPGPTVALAPLFATGRLVEELGVETDQSRRKRLLAAVEHLARAHPAALVPHLDDPRWYLVRNVVKALGGARRPAVVPHVEPLLDHPDERVRAEALRTIHRLDPAGAIPHLVDAVRHDPQPERAAALLGAVDDPAADRALDDALDASSDRGESLRLVAALGRRRTAASADVLTRLARRRFALFGTARALRTEARRILGSRR